MSYEQLKLHNQLCFPFYAVSRLIIREYQVDLDRLGLTYPQYLVMLVLWENEGITVNDIAQKLVLNTNTVTPLLTRMEKMNLLQRVSDTADKRKVMIKLTEKGKAMEEAASQIPLHLVQRLGVEPNEATFAEMTQLKNHLQSIIALLNNR